MVEHTSLQISLKKSLGFVLARKMKWTVLWLEQIFCLRWDPNITFIYWYVQVGAFVESFHVVIGCVVRDEHYCAQDEGR